MTNIRLTMAQALLRFLDQQYVELDGQEYKFVQGIIGIFGHGNVTGMGEALEYGGTGLPYIQGHNEQGMVHTAVAYAKQRNRLGIYACTTSIGPGALNMVTAAAVATVNRIPVLLLPGDIFACRQPDPVLQQIEVPADYTVSGNDAFRPVSRFFDRILRPEQLMTSLIQAMRVLTDPADTGAVTIALPQDVQTEAYDYPEIFFRKRVHHLSRRPPAREDVLRAVESIQKSKRPLIIAGGGVHYSFAADALRAFSEEFKIPVTGTQAGKGALTWDHEWNVWGIGVTGSLAGNRLAKSCDLVIAVGTRLADFTTASKTALPADVSVVSINVCRVDAVKMDACPVMSDALLCLQAIGDALKQRGYQSEYEEGEIRDAKGAWNEEVTRLYSQDPQNGLSQTGALGVINEAIEPDAVIVNASGSLPGDLHRLWRVRVPRTYHLEYGFSCMGYEVAGALGAKFAEPEKSVYALAGDGGYLMLHSELLTCVQEGKKITVIIFDNSGYQCIHNLQRAHGSMGFGNEFRHRADSSGLLTGTPVSIDFSRYAQALGAKTYAPQTLAELRSVLERAKADEGPVVIELKVLPGTGTDNYESWWRVGVAEVSNSGKVVDAHRVAVEHIANARPY